MTDWRDPKPYDRLDCSTLHEWAWEFLRRDLEYREFQLQQETFYEKESMRLFEAGAKTAGRSGERGHWTNSEEWQAWLQFRSENSRRLSRWGLKLAPHPSELPGVAKKYFWHRVRTEPVEQIQASDCRKETPPIPWVGFPDEPLLRFDLHLPIDEQVEKARTTLKRLQKQVGMVGLVSPVERDKSFRPQKQHFKLYVRLLDARLADDSIGEMARVLFAEHSDSRRSAKKALETAEAMANLGYLQLLLIPEEEE